MNNIEFYPGRIVEHQWENGVLICRCKNRILLKVEVYRPEIVRVRYATDSKFERDFSYALDPQFDKQPGSISYTANDEFILIKTEALHCRIHQADMKVDFLDLEEKVICRDEKGFHWEVNQKTGNDIVQMSKQVYPGEVYYGLGDKPCELNLTGKRLQNWGTDSYGYDEDWDPLYKNIPFYYGLHNDIGYGIFFDNTFRTFFDFAKERKNATSFWSHGGEMNYYFIAGPQLIDVNKRYALLTGVHDMPALWSLGFQQCKWSYFPEKEVRAVTTKMRELNIPCDAIYLDIDYMDGFRCFTWDKEKFPAPKQMVDDLKEEGFKTVVIIDPGIKIDHDYSVFEEAFEKGYFCRRLDGPFVNGIVWPGECYFPDFTRPEVREWWQDLYRELIQDIGIAGVWNDMNEPALFEVESKTMPDDVMFDLDGEPASHRKAHNVYGMQMARATYDGVKKYSDNHRRLVITRSGYAGLQRYSSVWTGDNNATWKHIHIANIQCQRLAVSGVSFSGSDIGGFIGQPTPEMFVRWIQLAIFHPFCRVHSSQDDGDQEPWSFGDDALDLFREAIELRYRMLPYHYTAFYQHHSTGAPILKPLAFYDQSDPKNLNRDEEFICGDHILTASIQHPNLKEQSVYLPKGDWYNYWTNKLFSGRQSIQFPLTDDTYPLFIKAGAIIPLFPLQQYVGEIQFDEVELNIYYKDGVELSAWYEDAHDGYEYETGAYRLATFHLEGDFYELRIRQEINGSYSANYSNYNLKFIGLPNKITEIVVDGQASQSQKVPLGFREIVVRW